MDLFQNHFREEGENETKNRVIHPDDGYLGMSKELKIRRGKRPYFLVVFFLPQSTDLRIPDLCT
jgi:hypothetical protein